MKHWLLLLLISLLGVSCHDDNMNDTPIADGVTGRRTVLVYMVAQNSLGRNGYQRQDSAEIMNGRQFLKPNDRLLLFIDDQTAPRLYQVTATSGKPRLVYRWETDFCAADPARFEEVLRLVGTQFPAREYGLVMWSHADGWIAPTDTDYDRYSETATVQTPGKHAFSFGIDSGPDGGMSNRGAQMGVEDMARAIQNAGMYCKYIFFDACLMQNIETAYALRHVTDYVVASPVSTPAAGSYYTHNLQTGFFSDTPLHIASTYLADVMSQELSSQYSDFGLSVACLKTDGIEELANVLKEALPHSKLAGKQSPEMAFTDEETGRTTPVLHYHPYCDNYYYRPHNYDALQALRCILPAEYYEKAKAALDRIVVYHGATPSVYVGPSYYDFITIPLETDDYRSVSMFVPQDVYTRNAKSTRHGDLNANFRQTEWYAATGFAATWW